MEDMDGHTTTREALDATDPAVIKAESLWDGLKSAFLNAERSIKEIIATKAWEPLGYRTFAEAWADRMSGVRLSTDALRVHVVYGLYDSGLHDEEVKGVLGGQSGVGPVSLGIIKRQREQGVPPHLATTKVRQHERSLPEPPRWVHVELGQEEFARYEALASRMGSSLKVEAEKAVRVHFERLIRESKVGV